MIAKQTGSIQEFIKTAYENTVKGATMSLFSDYNIKAPSYSKKELDGCTLLASEFVNLHRIETPVKNKNLWKAIQTLIQNFTNETNSYNFKFEDGNTFYIFSAPVVQSNGTYNDNILHGVGFAHFDGSSLECMWVNPFFRGIGLAKQFFLQYALNQGYFSVSLPISKPMRHVLKSIQVILNENVQDFMLYYEGMAKKYYSELSKAVDRTGSGEIIKFKEIKLSLFEIMALVNMRSNSAIVGEELIFDNEKLTDADSQKAQDMTLLMGYSVMISYLSENERIRSLEEISKFNEYSREYGIKLLKEKGINEEEISKIQESLGLNKEERC